MTARGWVVAGGTMVMLAVGMAALVLCAQPEATDVEAEPAASESPQPAPATLIEQAQLHREAGEYDAALAKVDDAILADPDFAALYLFRGQLQAEMAESRQGFEKSRLLTGAAADLDRYLARAEDLDGRELLEEQRDALLAEAEEARREAAAAPVVAEPQPTTPSPFLQPLDGPSDEQEPVDSNPPAGRSPMADTSPRRDRVVPIALTSAGLAAAVGSVLGATSFVAEQRCDGLCEADIAVQPGALSVAAVGSAVATGLGVWGTYRWARRAPKKHRRTAAIVTGVVGGSVLVATVVTGALAGVRWASASPSANGDLAGTQRLANASMSTGVFVAPLISSSLISAFVRSPSKATARR